ncbi:25446_t:CDS:1, partial [Gigaspora rosea]
MIKIQIFIRYELFLVVVEKPSNPKLKKSYGIRIYSEKKEERMAVTTLMIQRK